MNMTWIVYALAVIVVSILIGLHLGRFRIAYTEMSGMMLGMTMGMLNGFLLGYAAAAASSSMFWGNLFGILLGLGLGVYYGRAGGLMGVMDGGMGGVMGGSMGAMLAVMVAFPQWAQGWTAALLSALYVLGMAGLGALIEQSAPDHAALHRLLPMFTRAVAREAEEQAEETEAALYASSNTQGAASERVTSQRRLVDYYAVLGVPKDASQDEISEAYLDRMDGLAASDVATAQRVERALEVLTDAQKKQAYDRKLVRSEEPYSTVAGTAPAVGTSLSSTPGNSSSAVSERGGQRSVPRKKGPSANTSSIAASGPPNGGVTVKVPVSARAARAGSTDGPSSTTLPSTMAAPSSSSRPTESSVALARGGTGQSPVGGQSLRQQAPQSAQGPPTTSKNSHRGKEQPIERQKQSGKQARGRGQGQSGGQRPAREVQPVPSQQAKSARKSQARQVEPSGQQNTVISVPWTGGVAVILLLAALGWWVFTAASGGRVGSGATGSAGSSSSGFVGAAGETQAQLDQQAVVAQVGADGKQSVDIVLNSATFQYEPKVVKVKQGTPVHFNLSVKNGDPG